MQIVWSKPYRATSPRGEVDVYMTLNEGVQERFHLYRGSRIIKNLWCLLDTITQTTQFLCAYILGDAMKIAESRITEILHPPTVITNIIPMNPAPLVPSHKPANLPKKASRKKPSKSPAPKKPDKKSKKI